MERDPAFDPRFTRPAAADAALVVTVLILSIAAVVWVARAESRQADGRLAASICGMTIEVRDGAVRVLESDCRQQTCVDTRWIRRPGQVIACVPNRVLVVVDSKDAPSLDAITR